MSVSDTAIKGKKYIMVMVVIIFFIIGIVMGIIVVIITVIAIKILLRNLLFCSALFKEIESVRRRRNCIVFYTVFDIDFYTDFFIVTIFNTSLPLLFRNSKKTYSRF